MSQSLGQPPDAETPDPDPFRYGWRYVPRTLPDGTTEFDQVPLTLEDVLHPQEGDVIPENRVQEKERRHLHDVLERRFADDPEVLTLSDCLVDWGVRGLRNHSPDLSVFEGVRDKDWTGGVFPVAEEGGLPILAIEIVSPHTRGNDVDVKVEHYHRAGVRRYVIVDRQHQDDPPTLIGYVWTPDGYEPLAPDDRGRLRIDTVGILLGVDGDHLTCYNAATGEELGDYTRICDELERETAARRAAEEEAYEQAQQCKAALLKMDAAEQAAREQAAARAAAEKLAEAAERLAREQTQAREAAEQRAREQAAAREAAEKLVSDQAVKLRRLEALLQQLQGQTGGET